jgi:hypothetical protein
MEEWIGDDRAADGFNLMPPVLPEMLDVFMRPPLQSSSTDDRPSVV